MQVLVMNAGVGAVNAREGEGGGGRTVPPARNIILINRMALHTRIE
jgi:hypothetical protein